MGIDTHIPVHLTWPYVNILSVCIKDFAAVCSKSVIPLELSVWVSSGLMSKKFNVLRTDWIYTCVVCGPKKRELFIPHQHRTKVYLTRPFWKSAKPAWKVDQCFAVKSYTFSKNWFYTKKFNNQNYVPLHNCRQNDYLLILIADN